MIVRAVSRGIAIVLAVALLAEGFPSGDRSTAVALAAAIAAFALGFAAPSRGLPWAVFACAVTGGATAATGVHGVLPWPALVALWFAAGAVAKGVVRGAEPAPTALDRSVAELGAFWALAAVAAAASARTLWAAAHGLSVRALNALGTTDAVAARRTFVSLAAVFAGIAIYGAARRALPADRRLAVGALVLGTALSGAVAWLQSRGAIAAYRSGFWKLLGRFSGLESDPNAAGVLAALALGPALGAALRGPKRALWGASAIALAAGVAVSGSRSGILAAVLSVGALLVLERRRGGRRATLALLLLAAAAVAVLFASSRGPGGAAERLWSILHSEASFDSRTSSRRALWASAWEAFRRAPLGGVGWEGFSWRLPTLSASLGVPTRFVDNPGSFYLQILCETGLAGAALFAVFAGRSARAVAGSIERDPDRRPGAASLIGFAAALAIGSHLLAAEVSIAAFLLLAAAAPEQEPPRRRRPFRALAVGAAAILGWALLLAPTAKPAEAFRFAPTIGFYAPERGAEGLFRWMRPRAAVLVPAGGRFPMTIRFPAPGRSGETLAVRSEERDLFSHALAPRPLSIALVAPAGSASVFFLDSSFRFRPADAGIPDPRLLSLHVSTPR